MARQSKDFTQHQGVAHDEGSMPQEGVRAYLRGNPPFLATFLRDNPEMLAELMPPPVERGDGVVDLQAVMVARLRAEVDRLAERLDTLLSVSRANMTAQALMHDAVLSLLAATSFDAFIDVVTRHLAIMLAIDAASLCVEIDEHPAPAPSHEGVYVLPLGGVDALVGGDRDILLESRIIGSPTLYGPAASEIRSQALVRLRLGGGVPSCMLALGAREAMQFEEGQATELLEFLARTLETSLRRHLNASDGML